MVGQIGRGEREEERSRLNENESDPNRAKEFRWHKAEKRREK